MSRRSTIVLLVSLFIAMNLAIPVVRHFNLFATRKNTEALPVNRPEVAVQLQTHPHLQRVEQEIAAVATRTEDELIAALDLEWVVFDSGVHDGASLVPKLDFPRVLADRNLRRLDSLLRKYELDERRGRIRQLFTMAFERESELAEATLESLDRPPPKYDDPADIPKPKPITGRRVAVCGMLHLAAKHCGTAEVAAMLKKQREYASKFPTRVAAKPFGRKIMKELMVSSFLPDSEFFLNLWIVCSNNDTSLTAAQRIEVAALIEQGMAAGIVRSIEVEHCSWDSRVDWFDLLLLKAGPELLDRSHGTEKIVWYRWGFGEGQSEREELLAAIEKVVTAN